MDLYETIQDLYAEKERLERVIASLEALLGINKAEAPKQRGGAKRERKKGAQGDVKGKAAAQRLEGCRHAAKANGRAYFHDAPDVALVFCRLVHRFCDADLLLAKSHVPFALLLIQR